MAFRRAHRPTLDPATLGAFGDGSYIQEPVTIGCPERIHIGAEVLIRSNAWLALLDEGYGRKYDPELRIGDGTKIGRDFFASCVGHITIGANVLIADRVFIGDSYHGYENPGVPIIDQPMAEPRPVTIKDGAFIGVGAIILYGVTIGENAFVAAGSVVIRDVPARTVVAGNPGRVVRRWTGQEWAAE